MAGNTELSEMQEQGGEGTEIYTQELLGRHPGVKTSQIISSEGLTLNGLWKELKRGRPLRTPIFSQGEHKAQSEMR